MKIAIPTNDKISIADPAINAHYFKIFHVKDECIVNEEYSVAAKNNDFANMLSVVTDCDIIIARSIQQEFERYLSDRHKQVVLTDESIITNAINKCLLEIRRERSNTCCEP